MAPPQQRRYTLDDYFLIEQASPIKHEFFDGAILALAGASVQHNRVTTRLLAFLASALDGGPFDVFGSDLRIATADGLVTYPDLAVICGPVDLVPDRPDTLRNPTALVEVLSPSTRAYDAGEKLEHYRTVPSLREVLLVEPDRPEVRRIFRATGQDDWQEQRVTGLEAAIEIAGVTVPLARIHPRAA